MRRSITLPASLAALLGCGGGRAPAVDVAVRDSADVRITEVRGDLSSLPMWQVTVDSGLRIGTQDGQEE